MKLSVIIVNYNVRYFLEQALLSAQRALQGLDGELWVVDNNSADDSVEMVRTKFPNVHLIANTQNTGFATANNQAIRACSGEYILLLNPDTLVEENTFSTCIEFMDAHPEAGAVGVKMLDGSGKYLPESKRGFPSPWVSFCKTVGLHALFPKSPRFNQYYLGHLSAEETHPVDVLAGAFMFMRRSALDKAGLLDEAFFMYGEDIDLSYRIKKAGFENYYLPDTKIIHYKGESTKKGSLNYVKTFYQAMIIFANKHFTGRGAKWFVGMLQIAIWLRAGITVVANLVKRVRLPLSDAVLIFLGLLLLKDFWALYFYQDPNYFKPSLVWVNFPLYTSVWIATIWLHGGYEEPYDLRRLVRALGMGTLLLAAIYGFLDLAYRPSRALIVLGAAWSAFALIGWRALLHFRDYNNLRIGKERIKNMLMVGSQEECERAETLLNKAGVRKNIVHKTQNTGRLDEITRIFKADEIIFCSKDIPSKEILSWMSVLGPTIDYKILPEESLSIIGSSNKNEPGELYTIDIQYAINQPGQKKRKRMLDVGFCLLILPFLPFCPFLGLKYQTVLQNWWAVFLGQKTWVGYAPHPDVKTLPILKQGVFNTAPSKKEAELEPEIIGRLNFLYARDWNSWTDLELLLSALS